MLQNLSELKAVIDFLPSATETFHSDCTANPYRTVLLGGNGMSRGLMFFVACVAPCEEKPPCLDCVYRQRPLEHLLPSQPSRLWLYSFLYSASVVRRFRPMVSEAMQLRATVGTEAPGGDSKCIL